MTVDWDEYIPWAATPRKITSAAWLPPSFGNESICQLHKAGVRISQGAGWGGLYGGSPKDNTSGIWRYGQAMLNTSMHAAWVQGTLDSMVAGVDGLTWDLEGNEGVFNLPFAKGFNETLGTACDGSKPWQTCDQRFAEGLTNVMRLLKTEGLKRNPRFQLSFCSPVCKCGY
eukprot:SAG22_NODE_967_length_6262_cov_20.374980_3_plen_171_part_00